MIISGGLMGSLGYNPQERTTNETRFRFLFVRLYWHDVPCWTRE